MSNSNNEIIGILGSGRKNSNSKKLLEYALNGARSIGYTCNLIDVLDLNFSGCKACHGCSTSGVCMQSDDLTPLYDRFSLSRGIIIASPVYFYGLPGKLKLMVDRFQCIWEKQNIPGNENNRLRPGGLISIAGSKGNKVFDGVILTIKYFFQVQDIELYKPLLIRGWNGEPDDLPDDYLNAAFEYGREIASKITIG